MDKCEKCLYKANCQFLATHKKAIVEGCTAFKSEADLRVEVARVIFEEIEGSIAVHAFTSKSEDYADGRYDAIEWVDSKIANLKKKYTEGKDEEF